MTECFNDNNSNNDTSDIYSASGRKSEMFVIKFDEDKRSKINIYDPLCSTLPSNKPKQTVASSNSKMKLDS